MKRRVSEIPTKLNDSMLSDFAAIAEFLESKPLSLFSILDGLEIKLKQYAVDNNIIGNPDQERLLYSKNCIKRFKILTNVLTDWAVSNGFSSRIEKVIHYLPPRIFRSMQLSGSLFKDIGSSVGHGEWSHILQWYLIAEHNKVSRFLTNPPHILYRELGSDANNSQVWNFTFDLPEKAMLSTQSSFRCPGNLNKYLVSEPGQIRYPILHAILSKQEIRSLKKNNINSFKPTF